MSGLARDSIAEKADRELYRDALAGLESKPKYLPCKYLYDERGSQLFEQICELDEYYLTRCEADVTTEHIQEIVEAIGPIKVMVELGSGSSTKTRVLLRHLQNLSAYLPVDVSADMLLKTAADLRTEFPYLKVEPVVADFTEPLDLPKAYAGEPKLVYFPGSTIGNFAAPKAIELLRRMRHLASCNGVHRPHAGTETAQDESTASAGENGRVLLGIDLQKDPGVILRAYQDNQGVTEQFMLNILHRMNRELGADFDVDKFAYVAEYAAEPGRVEMYLVSEEEQNVTLGQHCISFRAGERILIEHSHKYCLREFAGMARDAGLQIGRVWTDPDQYFAVVMLYPTGTQADS